MNWEENMCWATGLSLIYMLFTKINDFKVTHLLHHILDLSINGKTPLYEGSQNLHDTNPVLEA